jgi:two-component system heavy metal sensor histidine kinase CusS
LKSFHPKRLPLAQRLTLLFVAVATAVLLGLGAVVAQSVERHFEDLDMEVLSGKMELITQALQSVSSLQDLTGLAHQLARSLVGHHGLEVMLLDADHTLLFATANARFDPQQLVAQASQANPRAVLWPLGDQTYRVLAAQIPTAVKDPQGHPQAVLVAAAIDIGHHQMFMQELVHTLWWFVAGAAVLMAVLGGWAVRRGLAPLRAMRAQAQVVTAQQLGHRLQVESMPIELAELAQSLNDMLARLEEAFKRLSEFSSDIAHELRTPVSNLMTQTQVALSRARNAEDYRGILESNAEEFERMARMISDMLLLAKADNGLAVPTLEPLNLAAEVRTLFDYYEALADEKHVTLWVEGDGMLRADRLMLRRALGNLLSNALRHANPGSTLRLRLETLPNAVQIQVTNQGTGIAPEHLGRVFDRFFRVDPARQRNAEGVGLGLAITKSIVLAHGGTITANSSHGETTFSISLPV